MPKTGRKGRGFYPRRDPATSRKALRLAKFGPAADAGDDGDKERSGEVAAEATAPKATPQPKSAPGRVRPSGPPTVGGDSDGRVVQERGRPRAGGYTPQFDRRRDRPSPAGRSTAKGPKGPHASLLPGEIRENRSHPGTEGREVYGGTPRTKPNSKNQRPRPRGAGNPTAKSPAPKRRDP